MILSPSRFTDVFGGAGMGNSLVWEQWTPKMLEGDFEGMGGTGLAIMRKDLGIATGQHPSCP